MKLSLIPPRQDKKEGVAFWAGYTLGGVSSIATAIVILLVSISSRIRR